MKKRIVNIQLSTFNMKFTFCNVDARKFLRIDLHIIFYVKIHFWELLCKSWMENVPFVQQINKKTLEYSKNEKFLLGLSKSLMKSSASTYVFAAMGSAQCTAKTMTIIHLGMIFFWTHTLLTLCLKRVDLMIILSKKYRKSLLMSARKHITYKNRRVENRSLCSWNKIKVYMNSCTNERNRWLKFLSWSLKCYFQRCVMFFHIQPKLW